MVEKLLINPHSPAYEAARAEMVEVLRQIGREDSRNGYTQMADDLAAGDRAQVPTWIALSLMATRAPADLRSALEAETIERCAQIATDMQKGFGVMTTERLGSYNAACRDVAHAIIALVGDAS